MANLKPAMNGDEFKFLEFLKKIFMATNLKPAMNGDELVKKILEGERDLRGIRLKKGTNLSRIYQDMKLFLN